MEHQSVYTLLLLLFSLSSFSALFPLPLRAGGAFPVLSPNFSSCHLPVNLPLGETLFNCCPPPASYSPRIFRPSSSSSSSSTLRVRRPSHSVNHTYAVKLARAYALMNALPADDPRSFYQQANIHCAYCNSAYDQLGSSQLFQVHNSWLFFPFHRWYLFFHERILAKLLGDQDSDSFALSFWNYDNPDGASIPWLFSSSSPFNSSLAGQWRDSLHNSSEAVLAIDYTVDTDTRPRHTQLRENDNTLYRTLIRDASTPYEFLGWPFRQGDTPMSGFGGGTVEHRPHDTVHLWVGSKTEIGWKDMGSFYAAARDPLFYSHHAQLDRLWEIWRSLPNHEDLLDEDYLNSEFVFYNEDAELVRVRAGDALETANLGYVYEEVETPWMDAIPVQLSSGPAELTSSDILCTEGEPLLVPCSIALQRDPSITRESPWLRERLVLALQFDPLKRSHLDVYLNLPTANGSMDTGCKEFLYVMATTPNFVSVEEHSVNTTHKPDLSERLADLSLTEESSVVVTLVPRFFAFSKAAITFLGCSIEYTLPTQRWDSSSTSFTK